MIRIRTFAAGSVLLASLVAGAIADVPRPSTARYVSSPGGERSAAPGYHVLAADFHVHSFPFSWSTLSPFETVIDARHHGLDVVALTPHNHLWVAQVGEWFSRMVDGPLVIVGEEITHKGYHLIGVGLRETVSNELPASEAIVQIHRQGGVAIAAHPYRAFWPGFDAAALAALDGTEVIRPDSLRNEAGRTELQTFLARTDAAVIGATDYHGLGPVGVARTYVFARERSVQGVLDAIRDKRTVVYDEQRPYGDPTMMQLLEQTGGMPREVPVSPLPGGLALFSRAAALGMLAAVLLFNRMT